MSPVTEAPGGGSCSPSVSGWACCWVGSGVGVVVMGTATPRRGPHARRTARLRQVRPRGESTHRVPRRQHDGLVVEALAQLGRQGVTAYGDLEDVLGEPGVGHRPEALVRLLRS